MNEYRVATERASTEKKLLVANLTDAERCFWERVYLAYIVRGGTNGAEGAADWAVHGLRERMPREAWECPYCPTKTVQEATGECMRCGR